MEALAMSPAQWGGLRQGFCPVSAVDEERFHIGRFSLSLKRRFDTNLCLRADSAWSGAKIVALQCMYYVLRVAI